MRPTSARGHTIYGDIKSVMRRQIPRADVVIGGPPCQGFSNLGSKDINDPRNQLWREYLRIVGIAKPKVFVIENVDRFKKSAEFALLLDETENGALNGYELSYDHLNAADFGVAQRRIRTIVVGSRIGPIELPKATHGRNPAPDSGLLPWNGTKTSIKGLPPRPSTDQPSREHRHVFRRDCSRHLQGTRAAHRPQPDAAVAAALRPRSARRWAVRRARSPSTALLAREANRHNGCDGTDAVGLPVAHHPHRVLQA